MTVLIVYYGEYESGLKNSIRTELRESHSDADFHEITCAVDISASDLSRAIGNKIKETGADVVAVALNNPQGLGYTKIRAAVTWAAHRHGVSAIEISADGRRGSTGIKSIASSISGNVGAKLKSVIDDSNTSIGKLKKSADNLKDGAADYINTKKNDFLDNWFETIIRNIPKLNTGEIDYYLRRLLIEEGAFSLTSAGFKEEFISRLLAGGGELQNMADASRQKIFSNIALGANAEFQEKILKNLFFNEKLIDSMPDAVTEEMFSRLMNRCAVFESFFYYVNGYFAYNRIYEHYTQSDIQGKTVVEIGPGRSKLLGIMFLACGAAEYHAIDIVDMSEGLDRNYKFGRDYIKFLTERFPKLFKTDILSVFDRIVEFDGDSVTINKPYNFYCPCNASDIPLEDESVDFMFSNACFEHFDDPVAAMEENRRLVKPGGIIAHQIDLRDHRDFENPWNSLTFSQAEWFEKGEPPLRTNRMRRHEYIETLEKLGFEIVEERKTIKEFPEAEMRHKLHADYKNLSNEELSVVGLMVIARKTA